MKKLALLTLCCNSAAVGVVAVVAGAAELEDRYTEWKRKRSKE